MASTPLRVPVEIFGGNLNAGALYISDPIGVRILRAPHIEAPPQLCKASGIRRPCNV
jgi:hypothetical protein